ncbi:MAG: MMPL family transporter [Treponema sp.]|nr:MMPL family transporter [Treponema sp.]
MKAARAFFKRPWIIIAVCVILTGVFGFFVTSLGIDNSIRQFLPQKDASYTRLTQTEDQFGSMIVIGVSLESTKGTVLTPENIEVVRKISDRVLELPQIEGVDSLTHIDYVCESDGSISASQLIPDSYTGTAEDIAQLEGRLAEWSEMYNRVIVNDDNTATQMQITLHSMSPEEKATSKITDAERQQKILEEVRAIVLEEVEGHPLKCKIYGDPVVAERARKFMISDLCALIPLVIIVVLLSLFFSFKTLDGTLLPLITVVMSAAWTMGLMALLGITFTLVSSVIPVALIAVGSAYGIHVLTHYYVALDGVEGELTREKYEEAIFAGLKEVMKAVLLARITTIVGFISLVSSPIEPLHSFAIFTAIGVGIALLLSITFIPALLLCKDFKKVQAGRERMKHLTDKVARKLERARQLAGGKEMKDASGNTLYSIYHFFCGSRVRLVLFTLVILGLSYAGLRMLKIDTAIVNYFPENCQLRQDIKSIDKNFAGTNSLYFTISGQEKGDLTNPEILKAVDDMQTYLAENYDGIGKIVSFTTFIKRINQVWHVPATGDALTGADSGLAAGDDSMLLPQTANTDGFDDFDSFDDFGDFGDAFAADDGFDDFGEFGESEDTSSTNATVDINWVDPNIEYAEKLSKPMTTQEVLAMLNRAYVAAGAKNATPEKMLTELEKECNYNGMAYYEIPYNPAKYPVPSREELAGVVNGYLTLLSGSLDRFVDDDMSPRVMRVTCQLRNHSTEETGDIITAAKNFAAEHFPEGYTIEATGAGEMEYTMTKMIVSSQVQSLLISLISVFIIITIAFGSGWAGLVGAVPLALAILLNYMVMGFAGINLDLVTSIIASVAVGVGIDYTIHFLTTYKEERAKTDNLEIVTRETFRKSGHGIVTNALAVGLGFLVLCFSKFVVLRYIGVLVAIVMFTSSYLAMTIIPGILNVFEPRFISKK